MNKVERFVYDLVKTKPGIKSFIRDLYQLGFDLLPRRKEYSINPISIKEGFFLGFHDIQPFSLDNGMVLSNKLHFDCRMPERGDLLAIGYCQHREGILGDFIKLGDSAAWNFHKGCRLQWLRENEVIFNTAEEGKLISKVTSISKKSRTIDFPIDSVSECGTLGTSFSYQRLEKHMPGYGYPYDDDMSYLDDKAPSETGLFLIDLVNNKRKLLVSLKELAEQSEAEEGSKSSWHYVTHTSFSKDSRYISFLHRWVGENKQRRFTKLMAYDLRCKNLITFPLTGNMASHYVWNESGQIVAYCNFDDSDCHALLDVERPSVNRKILYPQLNFDGHQSFIGNDRFVTDAYPNKWRMANLYLVDIYKNSSRTIASVYSPKAFQTKSFFKHIACDLHPRVSRDGRFVCFDTVKSGKRSLAVMSLEDINE